MESILAGAAGKLQHHLAGLAAASLVAAAGCATGPVSNGFDEPLVTCSGNSSCPSGFSCSADSVCVIAAAVAGSGTPSIACTSLEDTWTSFGQAFFTQNCGGACHPWASSFQGVGARTTQAQGAIAAGVMPPTGLPASDKQRAIDYLACGAPL
jgi:hypothetical protein